MTTGTDIEGAADPSLEAVPYDRVQVLKMAIPPGERRSNVVVAHVLVSRVIIAFLMYGRAKGPFPIRPPSGADGGDGATLFPEAAKVVTALLQQAAEADPVIIAHLRQKPPARSKAVAA